ncbi:MAG TPA: VOC family protein [Ignavibacteria bacterium]|nr:VOC family protein [Ignavibacteria bacterium]HMQ98812.1 VOC family protein [Ignavibacteria bacterium]
MQKVKPCLWFNYNADEALDFYSKVFKNFEVTSRSKYGPNMPGPEGALLTAEFRIEDQELMALNAGPAFKFTEAVSIVVYCEDQAEVDHYWEKLTEGGEESMCGWLKDKFGLSWQIVPKRLGELMSSKDAAKGGKVMQALLKMTKLNVKELEEAYNS